MLYDHNKHEKTESTSSSLPAQLSRKSSHSAVNPTQQPAWTKVMGTHPSTSLQRKPRENKSGDVYQEKTIKVCWFDRREDFYIHLVDTVAEEFCIPSSSLAQPLHDQALNFHSQQAKDPHLKEGQYLRVQIAIYNDPNRPFSLNVVRLERKTPIPKEARTKPEKATTPPATKKTTQDKPPTTTPESSKPVDPSLSSKAQEASKKQVGDTEEEGAYPKDVALFASFLIRGGYIEQVTTLIPEAWRTMSQSDLTAYLTEHYTEEQLKRWYLEKYEIRAAVKARFRKYNIVAALVVGIIWARENIAKGEWGKAALKIGGLGAASVALNRLLYARDITAEAKMAENVGNFGRWFQGVARTNKGVNFLSRRVSAALLLWDLKDIFMSGGMGGPNIPFDLIVNIDLDKPSTWKEPDQMLLDFGFNIWYRQICTPSHPEACTATPIYVAKVEGSATWGILKVLDIAPHQVQEIARNLYRIEGDWDVTELFLLSVVHRRVSASENILVVATGEISGEMVSGRGHYRNLKVRPANPAAVDLFGGPEPRWVPNYLLQLVYKRRD